MKVLILYATNSGGTFFASEVVKKVLEKNDMLITMVEARAGNEAMIDQHNLIILGSNTWFVDGEEGQMHSWFFDLQKNIGKTQFPDKQFAIFGLGDKSYFTFCESVIHLEKLVESWKGRRLVPSLRINRFYAEQEKKTEFIMTWVDQIIAAL